MLVVFWCICLNSSSIFLLSDHFFHDFSEAYNPLKINSKSKLLLSSFCLNSIRIPWTSIRTPSIRIRGRQHKAQKRPNTEPEGELELISFIANPEGGNRTFSIRIRCRQHKTQKQPNAEPEGELELISFIANPKGGNRTFSIGIRHGQHKTQKQPNTEPEGELELIAFIANPKGGNRTFSIRIRGRYILKHFSCKSRHFDAFVFGFFCYGGRRVITY